MRRLADIEQDTRAMEQEKAQAKTPEESLADTIRKISAAMDRLLSSGLNEKAVIILISHDTKIGAKTVREVLGNLRNLADRYTV